MNPNKIRISISAKNNILVKDIPILFIPHLTDYGPDPQPDSETSPKISNGQTNSDIHLESRENSSGLFIFFKLILVVLCIFVIVGVFSMSQSNHETAPAPEAQPAVEFPAADTTAAAVDTTGYSDSTEAVEVPEGDETVKEYRVKADKGDAAAQNNMGDFYRLGNHGVTQDYSKAVEWYKKAAEKGNVNAQSTLGLCYLSGNGVSMDSSKSIEWLRKAAEQDDAQAQAALGGCYCIGIGVLVDYDEGFKWIKKSADQGNAFGEYALGLCYENGKGVPENWDEAMRWYTLAANQGNVLAKNSINNLQQKRSWRSFENAMQTFQAIQNFANQY